jgi:Iron-containing redox enzyme
MNAQVSFAAMPVEEERHRFHTRLMEFNARRLKPTLIKSGWQNDLREELLSRLEEGRFVEDERLAMAPLLTNLPSDPDDFMQWFEALRDTGPGQSDRLFPWLAEQADIEQMRWFLKQEIAGEAGFDDLVALTQVRFETQPKLEMARNYWDEMGRGHEKGMHGLMLEQTAIELQLVTSVENTVWEALALANLMAALAGNRRYAYHSVGALGAIEMTAPGRVTEVNAGLQRLGVSREGRQYFQLHAGLDVRHSEAWNREVLRPIVAAKPRAGRALAEGALMRLRCGERCFERYRRELGVA